MKVMIFQIWKEEIGRMDKACAEVTTSSSVLKLMRTKLKNFFRKKVYFFEFSFQNT